MVFIFGLRIADRWWSAVSILLVIGMVLVAEGSGAKIPAAQRSDDGEVCVDGSLDESATIAIDSSKAVDEATWFRDAVVEWFLNEAGEPQLCNLHSYYPSCSRSSLCKKLRGDKPLFRTGDSFSIVSVDISLADLVVHAKELWNLLLDEWGASDIPHSMGCHYGLGWVQGCSLNCAGVAISMELPQGPFPVAADIGRCARCHEHYVSNRNKGLTCCSFAPCSACKIQSDAPCCAGYDGFKLYCCECGPEGYESKFVCFKRAGKCSRFEPTTTCTNNGGLDTSGWSCGWD